MAVEFDVLMLITIIYLPFSKMKLSKKICFYSLVIAASVLYSCKHDQAEFAMDNHQFIDSVYPEIQYQQQLNFEMQKIPGRNDINNLAYKRGEDNLAYIKELTARAEPQAQYVLKEEHVKNLALLRRQNPILLAELQALIISSDQKMIGFHVKASSSTGLKNAELRSWVEKKLHYWTDDLKQVQSLVQ